MIDTKLLDILACPYCRGDVEYDAKNEFIKCIECYRKYPVREGIPVMLMSEADTSEARNFEEEIAENMEKELKEVKEQLDQ